jgi:hypothetical protein
MAGGWKLDAQDRKLKLANENFPDVWEKFIFERSLFDRSVVI